MPPRFRSGTLPLDWLRARPELERRLKQVEGVLNVPGTLVPQVIPADLVVGDGHNYLTVGTVTVPSGVTVRVLPGGEWRTI